jgi:diguanylate cyclase
MVLIGGGICSGFGGFLVGAACVWLRGGRIRAELTRTRWAAEHDGLTGLPNRAGIRTRFEADRRVGRQNSLVLVDLNGFKQVNDAFGHQAGDRLLVEVARRLAEACPPAGFAGRLGGDEFLILLPQRESTEVTAAIQSLLARIAVPITLGEATRSPATLTATASAGIATATPESTWSAQLSQADIALYRAKAEAGGIVLFQEGMQHPPSDTGNHHRYLLAGAGALAASTGGAAS